MNLLLDTNAFIWWNSQSRKLSPAAFAACNAPSNRLMLSIVSVWEMQVKLNLGKLQLKASLAEIVTVQRQNNQMTILPLTLDHIFALDKLPFHHRNPFDRLIIAQAMSENAVIATNNSEFARYPITIVW